MYPAKLEVEERGHVEFLCSSRTSVSWKFQNGPLPLNAYFGRGRHRDSDLKNILTDTHDFWLRLVKATFSNNGIYSCHYYINETAEVSSSSLRVGK